MSNLTFQKSQVKNTSEISEEYPNNISKIPRIHVKILRTKVKETIDGYKLRAIQNMTDLFQLKAYDVHQDLARKIKINGGQYAADTIKNAAVPSGDSMPSANFLIHLALASNDKRAFETLRLSVMSFFRTSLT
jgi:hypothetical protein